MRTEDPITPVEVRQRVAILMADGRDRTSNDICHRIGVPRARATKAADMMVEWGLIEKEMVATGHGYIAVYRRAGSKA